MSKLHQITKHKLLIGEGIEEEELFKELLKKMSINQDIAINSYGGKNNLINYLETLQLIPGFDNLESLGITRDADNSIQSAFQSVCSALNKYNLPTPKNLNNPIANNGILKISLFFLPDNKNNGMLEDLCLQSVANAPGILCVENYLQCIQESTNRQPKNIAKAKVHAWLSSQIEPDKRLGEGAKKGYWDFNNLAFAPLKQFILSL
ncbi:MAG TPA: DUF3226 domain-containing protein [Allocoleopsis sp.]